MINIERLFASYPGADAAVFSNASARLRPGLITGIVGSNGSGKSTFARILARESSGNWTAEVTGLPAICRLYAQRPEDNVFVDLTVGRHLDRFVAADCRTDIERWFPELAGLTRKFPSELSGGQLQILGLATFFGQRAGLYILDEPTNHIASDVQERVMQALHERVARDQAYGLVVSHDRDLIERHSLETWLVDHGNLTLQPARSGAATLVQ